MKTKVTIAVMAMAIVTLSFSFVSKSKQPTKAENTKAVSQSPVGGFADEEIAK